MKETYRSTIEMIKKDGTSETRSDLVTARPDPETSRLAVAEDLAKLALHWLSEDWTEFRITISKVEEE